MRQALWIMTMLFAALALDATAAELPAQKGADKSKAGPTGALKKCNIGGISGVVGPNGVCIRLSGYVSSGFSYGPTR